ncbi:Xylanase inhibitor, C-terminal, partial [Dillenia turbinata]
MAHLPFITWTTMSVTKIILVIYFFSPVISFNASLLLERAFPHKGIEISMLHTFDTQRHLGMGNGTGVPHFNLSGSITLGLYYTKVKLGTPAKVFHVQVDTGSDLFWVSCSTCKNCPKYSQLDLIVFDSVYENDTTVTGSTNIIFGCTTSLTGLPTSQGPADGIIGLGHSKVSILSQLASREETPRIFSHCLTGEGFGGGVLLFGEILVPDLIYTPLVPSRFHYNVDVESLAINGRVLSIDPEVFKSSRYRGAIFDSGSTFVSLIDEAYIPFAHGIKTALSHLVPVTGLEGDLCYESSTSKAEDFPIISFEFAGKAIMHLRAEDYLVEGM